MASKGTETPWYVYLIPNSISLANGAIGASLVLGYFEDMQVTMLLIAMVLDGLDGQIARKLNACSAVGVFLDDICDVFSWVLAPVFIASRQRSPPHIFILAAFSISGFLRLFRFVIPNMTDNKNIIDGFSLPNVHSSVFPKVEYFTGLDTPSAALAWQCSNFNPSVALILAILMHVNLQFSVKTFGICMLDWEICIILLIGGIPQMFAIGEMQHFCLWAIFWGGFCVMERTVVIKHMFLRNRRA